MHRYLTALAFAAALAGCSKYEPPPRTDTFAQDEPNYVMVVAIDMSGSYASVADEKAYAALTGMIRQFYRDRSGEKDKLVIAQISGTPQAPIWEGTPKDFARQFGKADFRAFLRSKSNAGGSRVFDSISDALDYSMQYVSGKGRACLTCFTDFEDNLSKPGGEERLVQTLTRFSARGGTVGCYWVGMPFVERWSANLKRAGFPPKGYVVSSAINDNPPLPTFE